MRYILIDKNDCFFHDKFKDKIFVTYNWTQAKAVKKKKKDKLCSKYGFKVFKEVQ